MYRILILLLLQLAAPAQSTEPTVLQGTVIREGGTEPVPNVQITLESSATDPTKLQLLLNTASANGLVIAPQPGATMSETAKALSDAAVARGLPFGPAAIQNLVNQLGGSNLKTTTDANGAFAFKDLLPGRYTIRAERDGYFGKASGGSRPPSETLTVNVAGKQTEVSLTMVPGGIIAGRVFDATGLVSNVNVQAFTIGYTNGFAVMQSASAKPTDDRGEYRLFWLPPGDYVIGVTPRAAPAGVTSSDPQNVKTFFPGVTGVADATPVTIRGGENLTGTDLTLRTSRAFRISGQISDLIPPAANTAGPQVNSATLMLVYRDVNLPDDTAARTIGNVPLLPSVGTFDFPNIPPGSYDLFARVNDSTVQNGALGQNLAWGRVPLDVRNDDVRDLSIPISSNVALRGTVTPSNNSKLPPGVRVALIPEGGGAKIPVYQIIAARGAAVEMNGANGASGSFSMPSVPQGHFRLGLVGGLPPDFYVADVRQDGVSVFDSGFDVTNKTPNPIQVVLSSGAGSVSGIVQTEGQTTPRKPVAGAIVALVPDGDRRENRALYLSATSDASGKFTIHGVAPGDYKLFAWESIPSTAFQNAGFVAKYETRGTPVHVIQDGAVTVDLTVIPAIAIR